MSSRPIIWPNVSPTRQEGSGSSLTSEKPRRYLVKPRLGPANQTSEISKNGSVFTSRLWNKLTLGWDPLAAHS